MGIFLYQPVQVRAMQRPLGLTWQSTPCVRPRIAMAGYFISRAHCSVSVYCWNVTALPALNR
jgi:hypothetical protein